MNHPYLKNKTITIKALPGGSLWKEHFSKFSKEIPEVISNLSNKPYSFPDAEKQYCVPLASQGVKATLDNIEKKECPDFGNQKLTEQEYFEKLLNKDLNPYKDNKENWWTDVNTNKTAFPIIKNGRLQLKLNNPLEMIQYRIFEEHYRDEIAFSMAELREKRLNTYLYIVEDSSVENDESLDYGKMLAEAAIECSRIAEDKESIIKFFSSLGRVLDAKQSLKDLQKPLFALMQENPKEFLKAVKDPDIELKYLITRARKAGVITYNAGKDIYTLPSGKMGKLKEIIMFLKTLENEKELFQIQAELEAKVN